MEVEPGGFRIAAARGVSLAEPLEIPEGERAVWVERVVVENMGEAGAACSVICPRSR